MAQGTTRAEDGLFANHPGITALALTAFLRHPENKYAEADHPFIQKGLQRLVAMQQPNGAIYDVEMQTRTAELQYLYFHHGSFLNRQPENMTKLLKKRKAS